MAFGTGLSISGLVSNFTENTRAGLSVRVEAVDESTTTNCRTDCTGTFECTGLQDRRYRCFVQLDGSPVSNLVEVDVDDDSNEIVKLQLLDTGTVRIRTHHGSPSMTAVALRRGDQQLVYGQAGDDGAYEFHPLPLATYQVVSICRRQ